MLRPRWASRPFKWTSNPSSTEGARELFEKWSTRVPPVADANHQAAGSNREAEPRGAPWMQGPSGRGIQKESGAAAEGFGIP